MAMRITLLLCIMLFTGCTGDRWNDCVQPYGKTTTERRYPGKFSALELSGNSAYTLVFDTSYYVEIRGGKSLIHQIDVDASNGTLRISDNIICNWVRDRSRNYSITIHLPKISQLTAYNNAFITWDSIPMTSTFTLDKWSGGGNITGVVYANRTILRLHAGTGNLNLTGHTKDAYIFQRGFGFGYIQDLHASTTFIDKGGTGDLHINSDSVQLNQQGVGNTFLYGNPTLEVLSKTGPGNIVWK